MITKFFLKKKTELKDVVGRKKINKGLVQRLGFGLGLGPTCLEFKKKSP
jgi:hypothetical protein